jgi:predicted negative regulator of RcsB-dependent stress response
MTMYEVGTKKATMQVAMLLERLSRMSESMDARHRQATEQQERTVQALPGVLRQAANQTLGNMAEDATRVLRTGLNEPLADVAQRATEHQRLMLASTDTMIQTQRKLAGFVNKAIWLVAGVLAILLPVLAVGGYLGWHYKQVIAQHQIEADLLQAYNQADVRLCGNQLCARVDRTDKRYGDYRPIRSRPR